MGKKKKRDYLLIALICAVCITAAWWLLYANLPESFRLNGGVEALFTGLAFAVLIVTAIMQKEELELQRNEIEQTRVEIRGQKEQLAGQKEQLRIQSDTLKEQLFDTKFFRLLEALNNVVQNTAWYDGESQTARCYKGKESFKYIHRDWESRHKNKILIATVSVDLSKQKDTEVIEETINREWLEFYSKNAHNLGHYFRTLYHLVKTVDSAPEGIDRISRANIIRALLSDYEQALLFYNVISEYGRDEFRPLVIEYRLIKHVRDELLIHEEHRKFFPENTFRDR